MLTVREEAEAAQRASASAQPPESPGIYRSLRKRPNLNYAQAAGEASLFNIHLSWLWPITVPANGSCKNFIQCLMRYVSMVPWKAWPCDAQL